MALCHCLRCKMQIEETVNGLQAKQERGRLVRVIGETLEGELEQADLSGCSWWFPLTFAPGSGLGIGESRVRAQRGWYADSA